MSFSFCCVLPQHKHNQKAKEVPRNNNGWESRDNMSRVNSLIEFRRKLLVEYFFIALDMFQAAVNDAEGI